MILCFFNVSSQPIDVTLLLMFFFYRAMLAQSAVMRQ